MRIVLASVILLASAPAFATIFVGGSVDAGTNATLGAAVSPDSASTPVAAPGTYSAKAKSLVGSTPYAVTSYANATGDWLSADAGTVNIIWGWDVLAGGSGLTTIAETNQVATNWSYTFTASGNGSFDGRFNIIGGGDKFGLQSLYSSGDLSSVSFGGTVFDPTSSGTFAIPLLNGQTYTMAVFNFGNVGNVGGFDALGSAQADIDWQIHYDSAVPEPASWALMITGFGLVGAAVRRRRSTSVLA